MRCHFCGSELVSMVTDLPFKLNETTIVILKDLPVLQCSGCSEYLLEDGVIDAVAWNAFVSETYGSMAANPIERGPQGEIEAREPFDSCSVEAKPV